MSGLAFFVALIFVVMVTAVIIVAYCWLNELDDRITNLENYELRKDR